MTPYGRISVKLLGVILGALITLVLVGSVFFRYDFSGDGPLLVQRFSISEFFRELPGHLPWLAGFVLLAALVIPLRAFQWQFTLRKRVPFQERYHLVAIGAFCHNALPGKLGDFIRSFLMARSQKLPFLETLGSVAVCKLLEFAALMLLVAVSFLGPFGTMMKQFEGAMRIAILSCVGLVGAVVLLAHYSEPLAQALHRRHRFPKIQAALSSVYQGLGTARSFRGLGVALLASIPAVLAPALAYGIALRGLDVPGGLFAGAVVLGAIALGQMAPGIPAGTGLYYFFTNWAARSLGASEADAAAYSTLTHLATVMTQITVGAVSVSRRKFNWKDLRRRGKAAADDAAAAMEIEAREAPART